MIKIKRPVFLYPMRMACDCGGHLLPGQTLVEYALILAFISIVAIAVLINFGQQAKSLYSMIDSGVASAAASH